MMWTKKYNPNKIEDILGERNTLHKLEDFILNYKKQKKRSIIISGPAGVGKTCSVYAIANENDLEVLELNASDFRNKEEVNEIILNSARQASLFHKGKIILIDESDGFSGVEDRGGIQALSNLLALSVFPIVLTTNDIWQDKLSTIRSKSIILKFDPLAIKDILNMLKKISEAEGINAKEEILKKIASKSGGDARAAINDLQVLVSIKDFRDEDLIGIGDRERKEEVFEILNLIFKSKDIELISKKSELSGVDIDALFLWIEENLPFEYSENDLNLAYDNLSKSDVFRGRIRRWQYWRFLVYQRFLMSESVALSKTKINSRFVQYKRSGRILKIWQAKSKYKMRKSICEKLSKTMHVSSKRAVTEIFPYISNSLKKKEYIHKFGFSDDEIKFLNKL